MVGCSVCVFTMFDYGMGYTCLWYLSLPPLPLSLCLSIHLHSVYTYRLHISPMFVNKNISL